MIVDNYDYYTQAKSEWSKDKSILHRIYMNALDLKLRRDWKSYALKDIDKSSFSDLEKAKFAITGLNPHCETIDEVGEEKKIIIPAIKYLSNKRISIKGPFSADTFFSKKNLDDYDVAVGMYHDQVLTPMKTIFNFNAINITLGLPFLRVSPDHGPNKKMINKNLSNPLSLIQAIKFLDQR